MLKPLFDKVILKVLGSEDTTKSGIILASNVKEKTLIAEVVETGQGGKINGEQVEMYVKKGDKVLLARYAGTEMQYENQDFIILKQSDILAIIE